MQQLEVEITNLVQGIRNDDAQHRAERGEKERVKEQVKTVKACNGTVAAEVREYIEDIKLCIPLLQGIQGGMIEVVTKTVTGSLRMRQGQFRTRL